LPELKECPNCRATFYPTTKKQIACTRKCQANYLSDQKYFGGKRNTTIGLAEGVCQLCRQKWDKGLSSHHVLGKKNDPENTCLIALCRGCHDIVGLLTRRGFVDEAVGWENLIHLVVAHRLADQGDTKHVGLHVFVDIERITEKEWREYYTDEEPVVVQPRPKPEPAPRKKRGQAGLFNGDQQAST
jgi:hypothetical protein